MFRGILGDGLFTVQELGVLFTLTSTALGTPRFDNVGAATFKWISPDGSISTGAVPSPALDQIGDYKIVLSNFSEGHFSAERSNLTALSNLHLMTGLTRLFCSQNALTVLDVSELPFLTQLFLNDCNVSVLDVSNMPALQILKCEDNNISVLDVSSASGMEILNCGGNSIAVLDVSGMEDLEFLVCPGNDIGVLVVDNASGLEELICTSNSMTETEIDTILASIVASGAEEGDTIMSGNNAAPSAAGEVSKAILIGRGWLVETT